MTHFAEWVAGLGPEIANHLWQSTAFALAAWLVTLTLRANQARVRYAVWLAASIKFLIPFSLLIAIGNLLPHPKQPVAPVVYSAMDVVEEPLADVASVIVPVVHVPTLRERVVAALPVGLAVLWVLGAGVVVFRWGRSWRVVRRTLRSATVADEGREWELLRRVEGAEASGLTKNKYGDSGAALQNDDAQPNVRGIQLRLSAERMEPGIFGVGRPVLVWPQELSARLDDAHIEAIMAHELAHVRRRDNLWAVVHMLVETVFWFHPLVWWMERRMVAEREQACDEAVVHPTRPQVARTDGAPGKAEMYSQASYAEIYAEALLKTCRFCIESPLVCVAGVTGADLKQRVVEIVTGRTLLRMSWAKKVLISAAAVCVVAAPVVLGLIRTMPLRGQILHADGPLPSFEVATIRPMEGAPPPMPGGPPPQARDEIRFFVNTRILIGMAYNAQGFAKSEITGGPAWIDEQIYEVHAKINDALSEAMQQMSSRERNQRIELMEQSLLASRFKLKVHFETRELPEYALVVASGGAKLTPANPSFPHNGNPRTSSGQNQELKARRSTLQDFVQLLQLEPEFGGRLIVNKTGLTGPYDIALDWTRDDAAEANPQNSGPTLFTALQENLGLKLVPIKGPVEVIVIDHIEKPTVDGAEVTPPIMALGSMALIPQKPSLDGAEVDSSGESQLSVAYRKWLDEDAHWLITPQERTDFLELATDKDRGAFIDAFWDKRNAPGAAKGAYKAEVYARIAYANDSFAAAGKPGWATDRGRAMIQFGKPDSVEAHPADNAPYQVWLYRGLPGTGNAVSLRFVRSGNDYQLSGAWPQLSAASVKPLEFEVVSLKPSNPQGRYNVSPQVNADGVTMNATTLTALICIAYRVGYWQLSGVEPWMAKDRFDFQAKPPQGEGIAPYDERHSNFGIEDPRLRQMMQTMLAERFHVRLHRETTTGTVTILEQSGKPLQFVPSQMKGAKMYGESWSGDIGAVGGKGWSLYNTNMPQLAAFLSDIILHHPVIDKTGLDGSYDFHSATILTDDDFKQGNVTSMFIPAVKEMGLKLTETQGPVEKLAIDHAEQPTAN